MHVGAPKTGTSSIQVWLLKHRDRLLASHGVLYPRAGIHSTMSAHHNLVYEITRMPRFRAEFGSIADLGAELAATPAGTAVVSAEGLFRLAGAFAPVLDRLATGPVTIAAYIRRWDAYLESGYNQLARMGRIDESIEDFVHRRPKLWSYTLIADAWIRHCPTAEIRFVPFVPDVIGADVVQDFASRFLHLPRDPSAAPVRRNTRVGLKAIRGIYEVRDRCTEALGRPYVLTLNQIAKVKQRMEEDEIWDFRFLSDDLARSILKARQKENRWLAQRFPLPGRDTFFDAGHVPSTAPVVPLRGDGVFTAGERAALRDLADQIVSAEKQAANG